MDEEIHQGSEVPVTFGIDPSDRMPVPVAPDNQDRPPPLAVDTLVCMEDRRSFVIRNSDGSIWVSFEPKEVQRLPNGEYAVEIDPLMATVNRTYPDRVVHEQSRQNFTSVDSETRLNWEEFRVPDPRGGYRTIIRVEPIRPICEHYLRIQTDISADRERRYLTRSCMAQRSETGEYTSVGDAAIFACSLRSPRHLESEQILEDFDALSMRQSLERVQAGSFDVDAELAAEADSGLGVLGSK